MLMAKRHMKRICAAFMLAIATLALTACLANPHGLNGEWEGTYGLIFGVLEFRDGDVTFAIRNNHGDMRVGSIYRGQQLNTGQQTFGLDMIVTRVDGWHFYAQREGTLSIDGNIMEISWNTFEGDDIIETFEFIQTETTLELIPISALGRNTSRFTRR